MWISVGPTAVSYAVSRARHVITFGFHAIARRYKDDAQRRDRTGDMIGKRPRVRMPEI